MNKTPFSLRIFVVDGDPDGLRIAERSNWVGKSVIFPRTLYPRIKGRDEFKQTGVYLLIGTRETDEVEMIYIGEGDPVGPRIDSHFAKKDFWNKAVFFTAGIGHLNKAHVQYLEAQLIQKAKSAKQVPLDNKNAPSDPSLSEADKADMDVFLYNLLTMLPVLGVHAFEETSMVTAENGQYQERVELTCKGNGVVAHGFETTRGFQVKRGSQAKQSETPSIPSVVKNIRSELRSNGVLAVQGSRFTFTQDFVFNSPSLAAATVLGRSTNGRTKWRDKTGRTLKEIQAAQTVTTAEN